MRGRSYSPSPPRGGHGRRGRSPSPRGRYAGRGRDPSTSLLVRNLRLDCRPEDLRRPFGQFGPLKDIYLPRDYYSGAPRGFGFVQFVDPADAADAKYRMDGQVFQGRELTVVFAEENRKKPGVDIVEENVLLLVIHVHLETLVLHLDDIEGLDPAAVIPIPLRLNDGNTQDLFHRKTERRVGKGLIPQKVEEGHILVHHHLAATQGAGAGAGLRAKAPERVRAEAGAHIQKTMPRT